MLQVQAPGLLVEQTQHHPFTVGRGQGRDADVHLAPADPQGNPPILGNTLLGDVQPCHDLDPRYQQGRQLALGLQHLAQHAVDAEAHHQAFLEGFQVDVRGVLADRLAEDRVDQANDRRVVLLLHQVLGFRDLVGQRGEVQAAAEVLGELHGRRGVVLVGGRQGLVEGVLAERPERQAAAGEALRLGDRRQLHLRPAGQPVLLLQAQEQQALALGEAERQTPWRCGRRGDVG